MPKAPAKTEASKRELIPIAQVAQVLTQMQPKFGQSLPKHIPAERFTRVCLNTIQANPRLLECEPNSLYRAVQNLAHSGLEPDPAIGHASIVPRWNYKENQLVAHPMIHYGGYIELARRSNDITSISCHLVYEKDEFIYEMGLNEKLEHTPAKGDRGDWIKVYCIAKFRTGHHIEVMDKDGKEGVYAIRDRYSESYKAFQDKKIKDTPWISAEGEMARKTVLRRARKYWPMSIEDRRQYSLADTFDDAIDKGKVVDLSSQGEVQYIAPASDSYMSEPVAGSKSGRMLDHIGDEPAGDSAADDAGSGKSPASKGAATKKAAPKEKAADATKKAEPAKEREEPSPASPAQAGETTTSQSDPGLGPLTVYDSDGTMVGEHNDPSDFLQELMNIIIAAPNRVPVFKANDPTLAAVLKARPDLQGSVDQINEYRPS